jgi:hypothetical protein
MKTIDEIDLNDYILFFLTEEKDAFKVENFTGDSYQEIQDYDLIQTSAGVLIGYKKLHNGHNGHSYLSGDKRFYYSATCFDDANYLFDSEFIDRITCFVFINSVKNPPSIKGKNLDQEEIARCDLDSFGGTPYYIAPEDYVLKKIVNVIDLPGVAHVVFLETHDVNVKNLGAQVTNTASRTITGIVRVISDWAKVYDAPFNNGEDVSYDAKRFIESGIIPEDVIEWCVNNQPESPITFYLSSGKNVSEPPDQGIECPEFIKNFFRSKWRYSTITSLFYHHPNGNKIDKKLVDMEKSLLDREVYNIAIHHGVEEDDYDFLDSYFDNIDPKSKVKKLYEEYRRQN